MSAPTRSLPGDIFGLLLTTCGWEKFTRFDGHGEPSYASLKTKICYREAHSMLQTGYEVNRQAELSTSDPDFDLYFDGDDPDPKSFSTWDRFTYSPGAIGSQSPDVVNSVTAQPTSINTVLGPWGAEPWLVVVSF